MASRLIELLTEEIELGGDREVVLGGYLDLDDGEMIELADDIAIVRSDGAWIVLEVGRS